MIAIVVVNWNGHRDTAECLESLMRLDEPLDSFRIIVSDNGSEPGSVETIIDWCSGRLVVDRSSEAWQFLPESRRHSPNFVTIDASCSHNFSDAPLVTILRNEDNLGFAGGNNAAIRLALTNPAVTAVWLLNNDTVCRADALSRMEARIRADKRIGMIGSTLLYYDNPRMVQGVGGWFNGRTGRGDHIGKFLPIDSLPERCEVERSLTYVIGASMLVRREFIESIGLMYEGYFLYFEETDWSERNAGKFLLGWEPSSFVYHKEGGSIGTSLRHRPSNTSIYYLNRNLLLFTWRHYRIYMPVITLRVMFRAARFILTRDMSGARIVSRALVDFFIKRTTGRARSI